MKIYQDWAEVTAEVADTLGPDAGSTHDVEGIATDTHAWHSMPRRHGFRQVVTAAEFWQSVERHVLTGAVS